MLMTTFVWKAGLTGDWNDPTEWAPTGGPPGLSTSETDVAVLNGTNTAYVITINTGEQFDLATLSIAGGTGPHTTDLLVSGSLLTDALDYSGGGADDSIVDVQAGGLLNIRKSLTDTGTKAETISIAGTGIGGGTLELGSVTNSGININNSLLTFSFDNAVVGPSTGVIEFNGPTFTIGSTTNDIIANAAWGDTFVFDHADFTGDTFTYSPKGNTANELIVTTTLGIPVLTMNNVTGPNLTSGSDFLGVGDTIQIVCYARGTMLRTPHGELPVEKLRAGKQIIALVDGQETPKAVVWLGHRRINITGHSQREQVAPIRIRRDAVADGMPHRDLIVSPDHAIFVDGKLICARQLVNGSTIGQESDWTAVDYYHVELAEHAILFAEGLPAESYLDTGNSGFFENSNAPLTLHPDLTSVTDYPSRETGSCMPFVWDEASVLPVWQRLADRAAAIGLAVSRRDTTTDANLRLLCSNPEHNHGKPIYADSNLVIFVLPRGAERIRLLSRAQAPTEARPWVADRRRLGVRVKRIVLRGTNEQREVPMDHPGLNEGWWDIEREGQTMSRWTDGDAVVPLPKMEAPVILELHLAGEMIYAAEVEPERQTERRAA
jgi:hypothetical protein